jgi:hypothetical protein
MDEGRGKECPKVVALDADADENMEVAGEGFGCTPAAGFGGVSVIGNPRLVIMLIALVKSSGLWNFN